MDLKEVSFVEVEPISKKLISWDRPSNKERR